MQCVGSVGTSACVYACVCTCVENKVVYPLTRMWGRNVCAFSNTCVHGKSETGPRTSNLEPHRGGPSLLTLTPPRRTRTGPTRGRIPEPHHHNRSEPSVTRHHNLTRVLPFLTSDFSPYGVDNYRSRY